VLGTLVTQTRLRDSMQFRVHQSNQPVQSPRSVRSAQIGQGPRDIAPGATSGAHLDAQSFYDHYDAMIRGDEHARAPTTAFTCRRLRSSRIEKSVNLGRSRTSVFCFGAAPHAVFVLPVI